MVRQTRSRGSAKSPASKRAPTKRPAVKPGPPKHVLPKSGPKPRHQREYLEDLVRERTRELAATSERLSQEVGERARADEVRAAIYEISEATQTAGSLDELFRSIHSIVGRLMAARNFYIALYDPASNLISFPYFVDEVDERPAPFPLGRGLTSHVLRTGKPLFVTSEVRAELEARGELQSLGAPSTDWLGVPLVAGDTTIGVLVVQSYTEGARYGEQEKNILTFVSGQVAVAIERKRAEEALRASEAKLRAIFEALPDIILVLDQDGRYREIAPSNPALLYRPADELIGRTLHEIFPRDQADFFLGHVRRALETGQTQNIEYTLRIGDRDLAFASTLSKMGEDRVVALVRDITERRRAVEALARSEALLRAAFDHTAVEFWVRDAEGRCLMQNVAAVKHWGDQVGNRPEETPISEDELAIWLDNNRRALAGEVVEGEVEYLVHGEKHTFFNSVAPFRVGDRVVGTTGINLDVTERKRAEEALRESDQVARALINATNDNAALLDASFRALAVNATIATSLGTTPEALIGTDFFEHFEAGVGAERRAFAEEVVRTGKSVRFEDSRRGRWFDSTFYPVFDAGGAVTRVAIFGRDITDRRNAETALRESEERYRMLFQRAPVGVFNYDTELRITDCNEYFVSLLRSRRERLIGLDMNSLNDPRVLPAIREAITGGTGEYDGEYRGTTGPADVVVSLRTAPLHGAGDTIIGAVGVVADMTEQKRAETALRESEERYRTILQEMMEGYFEIDLKGTMMFCNDAAAQMLGYTREQLVGLNNRAFMDEANAKRVFQVFNRVYRTGELSRSLSWELIRHDGRPIVVENSIALMRNANGQPIGFRGICHDITERKMLEEQLLQSQKMEVVGTLAGGVAHDFNNLLQAMLSHAQLLRSQSKDAERVLAVARELEQHINRGAALTRQLLLFSRRETVKTERLDLNDAVRDTSQVLARLVRANIALVIELAPESLVVEADRGQLQQVLMNLTLNASDAMPDGGRLVIRTAAVGDEEACLAVEDNGEGIPEAIRERIFEPFFTTKEAGRGTGLGLAVVHGIVTSHRGRIEMASTVGKGTTFRVVLPRVASAEEPSEAEPPGDLGEPARGSGERVLVVEDEPGARDGLRDLLGTLGYRVEAVGSGEQALGLVGGPPFDLLLTDLMLPGASGAKVARQMKTHWPALRVILMSGYTEDMAVRRDVNAGSTRFLQKPFDLDTLARNVRDALDEPPDPQVE